MCMKAEGAGRRVVQGRLSGGHLPQGPIKHQTAASGATCQSLCRDPGPVPWYPTWRRPPRNHCRTIVRWDRPGLCPASRSSEPFFSATSEADVSPGLKQTLISEFLCPPSETLLFLDDAVRKHSCFHHGVICCGSA